MRTKGLPFNPLNSESLWGLPKAQAFIWLSYAKIVSSVWYFKLPEYCCPSVLYFCREI